MASVNAIFYVIVKATVDERGYVRGRVSSRMTAKKPSVGPDEVPVRVQLNLPVGLFRRPSVEASITVPENNTPTSISAEVQDNIAKAIREATGMNVTLSVSAPQE